MRWETLKTQGRGFICDLSSSGCFVLSGGEVAQGELARLDLLVSDEVVIVWGTVVYTISEMGFALRFLFGGREEEDFIKAVRALEATAANE